MQGKNETREWTNSSGNDVLAVSAQGSATIKLVGVVDMVLRGVGREGEGERLAGGKGKTDGVKGEKGRGKAKDGDGKEKEGGEKGTEGKVKEQEGKQGVKWYVYTSLSSVHMPRSRGAVEDGNEDGDENEVDVENAHADEDADAGQNANADANADTATHADKNAIPNANPNPEKKPNTKSSHSSNTGLANTPRPIPVLTVWIARSRIAALGEAVGGGERVVVW